VQDLRELDLRVQDLRDKVSSFGDFENTSGRTGMGACVEMSALM